MSRSLIFTLLVFFLASTASAALRLTPEFLKLTLEKNANRTEEIIVRNDNAQAIDLVLEPEIWYGGKKTKSLPSWFNLPSRQIHLKANSEKKISIKLATPIEKGESLIMLFFAEESKTKKSLSIRRRIGVPIYIRQQNTTILKAKVETFNYTEPDQVPTLSLALLNQGNNHLLPFGGIILTNKKDGKQYFQEAKFKQPIFPDRKGSLILNLSKLNLEQGNYHAELNLFLDTMYPKESFSKKPVALKKTKTFTIKRAR